MRICFINPHSDPLAVIGEPDSGGQCVVEKELMENFTKIYPDVEIESYTRRWGNKPLVEKICDRATVVRIECCGNDFIPKENLWECLPEFADEVMKYWNKKNYNYNICHAHYADGGKASLFLKERVRMPLVFTAHSLGKLKQIILPDEKKFRYSLRIPAEIQTIERSSKIIALNSVESQNYKKLYNVDDSKLKVIPNGVDTIKYSPLKNRNEVRKKLEFDDKLVVWTTGRLDDRKGFDVLAKALNIVFKSSSKKNLLFLFPVGGETLNDDEKKVIESIKSNLGDALNNTIFFKRLSNEELIDYYGASDLFVCPSPYEPFGLVVIESLSCATPVVAFNNAGPADIISHNKDGMLAELNNVESLAQNISSVLRDEKVRVEMGISGRKKVEEKYSWRSVAVQTMKLYKEAMSADI